MNQNQKISSNKKNRKRKATTAQYKIDQQKKRKTNSKHLIMKKRKLKMNKEMR